MFVLAIIRTLISLYCLVLIVNFLLPYISDTQKPWMVKLNRVCEPALKIGRNIAAKVLPNRTYPVDMNALFAVLVFLLLSIILGWLM